MNSEQIVAQSPAETIENMRERCSPTKAPLKAARILPAMPIRIFTWYTNVTVTCAREEGDYIFRFADRIPNEPELVGALEAYALREMFLEVDTPGRALDFLAVSGRFQDADDGDEYDSTEDNSYNSVTWTKFKYLQNLVSVLMSLKSTKWPALPKPLTPDERTKARQDVFRHFSRTEMDWLDGGPSGLHIYPKPLKHDSHRRNQLVGEITVHSALEAILATLYLDGLVGVQYRLCALKDCQQVFEITSNHEREYCSQRCAHNASVRRRRAADKAAKTVSKAATKVSRAAKTVSKTFSAKKGRKA
jgi:hypothetical protein